MTTIMNNIGIWGMVVDVGLVTAILLMAFRYMKGSRAQALLPRTMELESSLRSLISEADAAGRHLNDQLLRREQNLQRLLGEVEATEQRISRVVASAEERGASLDDETVKARALLEEFTRAASELRDDFKRGAEAPRAPRARQEQAPARQADVRAYAEPRRAAVSEPEPVGFEELVEEAPQPRRSSRPAAASAAPSRPAPAPSSMRGSAASYEDAPTARDPHADLRNVYATAENLLKEGRKVEQVSAQTRLPVEELRMLSQMIEIEREEDEAKNSQARKAAADPRLGALGGIRRQSQTI